MNILSSGVRFLLVVLALSCDQTQGLKLFRHEDSTSAIGELKSSPPVFGLNRPVKSGARSAYQLAPFGEGFGFADLFGQPKQAKQLDNNLAISIYDDQTPIIVNDNYNEAAASNQKDDLKSTIAKARLLNLTPWNRIIMADRKESALGTSNQTASGRGTSPASPIILVPGYGGSRLEVKLDKPSCVHYFCDSKTDWTDLWINVKQLLPYMIDCLIDNMRLEFDSATNRTRNPAGVDIRVKNGSQVSSVEYLNSLQISGFAYFAPIIEQLTEGKLGYERELNIRAAPYDFRKAPNELGEYFEQLKESSEQLVRDNGGRSITFVCHSMGCNNMLYFLRRQNDDWKSKHVRRLISIAAPWAGSVSAMRAAAVGDDLGMPYLFSESKLLLVQRSLPSTIFLFPHRQVFSGIPLVRANVDDLSLDDIPSKSKQLPSDTQQQKQQQPNDLASDESETQRLVTRAASATKQPSVYTADDFRKFFEDINHPDGYKMWLNTKDLLGSLEAPGVEVWCLVGSGKRTLARIEYVGEFPTSASQEIYDDGDGTVTTQSADHCKRWSSEQQQLVYYKQFETDHLAILKDANVLRYVERILDSDLATNNLL